MPSEHMEAFAVTSGLRERHKAPNVEPSSFSSSGLRHLRANRASFPAVTRESASTLCPQASLAIGLALVARSLGSKRSRGSRTSRWSQKAAAFAPTIDEPKVDAVKALFEDVLDVRLPQKLRPFLAVLQVSGFDVLEDDEWKRIGGDLHPFLLPVAKRGAWDDDDLEVIGFLIREPNGKSLSPNLFQVVTQKPRISKFVNLVAVTVDSYIAKRAEEATFRNEKEDLAVIEITKDVYDVKFSGKDRNALDKWLLLEVGAFPDVYRNLAFEHIEAGDRKTGLVIADTMRESSFSSWAFPHAFVSKILSTYFDGKQELEDRSIEGNHCAMQCFKAGYPLWTLEDVESLEQLVTYAQMPKLNSMDDLRVFYLKRSTDDQRAAVRTGNLSLGCAAMAKGQALMDAVVCGHKSYNGVRQELAEIYDEVPGCEALVDMIYHFKEDVP